MREVHKICFIMFVDNRERAILYSKTGPFGLEQELCRLFRVISILLKDPSAAGIILH